jgi:hypothetical protein
MRVKGQQRAEEVRGATKTFVDFARRLMQVPHSEVAKELDAERVVRERQPKRASRAAGVSSKKH